MIDRLFVHLAWLRLFFTISDNFASDLLFWKGAMRWWNWCAGQNWYDSFTYIFILFVLSFSGNFTLLHCLSYYPFPGIVLGENFIVSQILPLLKNVVRSCIGVSFVKNPDPVQCWNSLALVDCLRTLDGLVSYLPKEVVVTELIEVIASLSFSLSYQIHISVFHFLDH